MLKKMFRIQYRQSSILTALILLLSSYAFAEKLHTSYNHQSLEDSTSQQSTVTVGLNYASNSVFFGRNTAIKYPYVSADITYAHKSGLWATSSVYQIFNSSSFIDETDLSIGYDFNLSPIWDASLSYSRYFFSAGNPIVKSSASNLATAFIGYDWYYLYSGLSLNYIMRSQNEGNDLLVVFSNSRYFYNDTVFSKHDRIAFEPVLTVTGGTQQFASSHIDKKGSNKSSKGGNNISSSNTRFAILNYAIKLPLTYTYKNFSVEAAWRFSIPVNLLSGDESQPQSIFFLSAYYVFEKL